MTDIYRSALQIQPIFVPKAREPWLKRPLDVTFSSLESNIAVDVNPQTTQPSDWPDSTPQSNLG